MKTRTVALAIALAFCIAAGSSCAAESTTAGPVQKPKAGNGLKNLFFGWLEIPKSIIQVTDDSHNPLWGLTGGAVKGIVKAFPKTIIGFSDATSRPASAGAPADAPEDTKASSLQ